MAVSIGVRCCRRNNCCTGLYVRNTLKVGDFGSVHYRKEPIWLKGIFAAPPFQK